MRVKSRSETPTAVPSLKLRLILAKNAGEVELQYTIVETGINNFVSRVVVFNTRKNALE